MHLHKLLAMKFLPHCDAKNLSGKDLWYEAFYHEINEYLAASSPKRSETSNATQDSHTCVAS